MAGTTAPLAHQDEKTLRSRILALLGEAEAIVDGAESDGRDLNEDERKTIEDIFLRAGGLEKAIQDRRIKSAGGAHVRDSAFSTSMTDLAALFSGSTNGPQTKATRGATWGKAVVAACSDGPRFKGITPAGSVLVSVPAPEPVAMGRPVASLRSLIPSEGTEGTYAFLRQTVRTNNAAPVPHGQRKPTSVYEFERVQRNVSTIAHLSEPIARQDLADAVLLQEFIGVEMLHGTEVALDDQVLNGDGTGVNLLGLANTPGVLTVPAPTVGGGWFLLSNIRKGITRLDSQGLAATGIVVNPVDYEAIETADTEDGGYILASAGAGQAVPVDRAARRIWGVPVVTSVSCPLGVAWLADFAGSTKLWSREETRIDWSEHMYRPDHFGPGDGASLFEVNEVVFRAEGRWGFGVTRPSGVVRVALA